MKVHWPNNISNNKLQKVARIIKLEDEIKIKRWKYIGHTPRRDRNDNIRTALTYGHQKGKEAEVDQG